MKKLILSLAALAMMAFAFTSCEDVPEPYDTPTPSNDTTKVVLPTGSGTADDPYNVTKALQIIKGNTYTSDNVYTKGIITDLDIDTSYGNATYYISDIAKDKSNTLEVYRGYYYNGDKFTSTDQLSIGDTVVIYGALTNFNGTYEIGIRNQIYSVNGKVVQPKESIKNTPETAYTVAKALELVSNGKAGSDSVYVKGIVTTDKISYNSKYNSITYYISDDGKTDYHLQIYSGKGLNGAAFSSKDDIKPGQTVVVYGLLKDYNGKAEIDKENKLISISGDGGSTDTPTEAKVDIDGTTVTLTNPSATAGTETASIDFNAQKLEDKADVTSFKLSDGTTITFDANGQKNGPKFYKGTKGIRVYLNNTISFAGAKKIAKIVMTCDTYKDTDYVGNKGASVTFNGNNAVYTNSDASVTKGGGVQLRVQTITITYAK